MSTSQSHRTNRTPVQVRGPYFQPASQTPSGTRSSDDPTDEGHLILPNGLVIPVAEIIGNDTEATVPANTTSHFSDDDESEVETQTNRRDTVFSNVTLPSTHQEYTNIEPNYTATALTSSSNTQDRQSMVTPGSRHSGQPVSITNSSDDGEYTNPRPAPAPPTRSPATGSSAASASRSYASAETSLPTLKQKKSIVFSSCFTGN